MTTTKFNITATCYSKSGEIISTAQNSYTKTHPIQAYFAKKVGEPKKIYLHAEIAALLKAKTKKVYAIAISRKNNQGKEMTAKPCKICMEAIKAFGVKKMFYSDSSSNIIQLNME